MDKTVGVLGGGQLGRMLMEVANRLGVKLIVLDTPGAPARQISAHSDHIDGSFTDPAAINRLAAKCDVLTIEIEHVNAEALRALIGAPSGARPSNHERLVIYPSPDTILNIQDKYSQKERLMREGINVARAIALQEPATAHEVDRAVKELGGYPIMLKARKNAYDGRGNYPVRSINSIPAALEALQGRSLYAEQWANFKMELAVMIVKTRDQPDPDHYAATLAYPVVETIHQDSICKLVYAPARRLSQEVLKRAQELARRAVAGFSGKGIFGVEMFLLDDDSLLVNEIAPRVHNSGHYTMEACAISQFEAHLRAILGLPLCQEDLLIKTPAVMLNILGGVNKRAHLTLAEKALEVPQTTVHLYGKGSGSPGRKMGHMTVVGNSMDQAEKRIEPLIRLFESIKEQTVATVINNPIQIDSSQSAASREPFSKVPGKPLVAVIMGSDSDLSKMKAGIDLLVEFGIPHLVTIVSAHRQPDRMASFARNATSTGLKVIIAGAGGAAHLPGMVAAYTNLPVIGVPIKGSDSDGQSSLRSIVDMPRGVPVATVANNNSANAVLLAIRILALSHEETRARYESFVLKQKHEVDDKALVLEEIGTDAYLCRIKG